MRPGMYIGDSTGNRGLHHLVFKVVDNSVDEALAGACTDIEVTLWTDGSVSVLDNGHGIPVEERPDSACPPSRSCSPSFTAGGKFGNNGYKVSGGLHGVGVSVVNPLSEWLEVEVRRDGRCYQQRYEQGNPVTALADVGEAVGTGTRVRFKPDVVIFTSGTEYRSTSSDSACVSWRSSTEACAST